MKRQPHEAQKEEDTQWAALLRQLQGTHDECVLKQLLDQTRGFVFAVTYHYTRDRTLAEDAREKALIRLARSYAKIRDPMQLRWWLRKTAKRFAKALVRPKKLKLVLLDDSQWEEIYSRQGASPTPLELLMQEDTRLVFEKALIEALPKLPERYGRCLYLRVIKRLDPSQVAETMGISLASVYQYTARALPFLADEPAFKELHDEMSK